MSAHAVSDRKNTDVGPDNEAVLVPRTYPPDVAHSKTVKDHTGSVFKRLMWASLGMALARPDGMLRRYVILAALLGAAGCRRNPEDTAVSQPAPPPAAALARQGVSLDQSLRDLEKELSAALGTGLDKGGMPHILTAEAITDRLLESRLPFAWLKATSYSLEGYVRQIQSLADRIVAESRSGVDKGMTMRDVIALRRKVIDLRHSLAIGGVNPPMSLDSLLANTPADSTLPTDAGE